MNKILIVDDENLSRKKIRRFLEDRKQNFTISEARSIHKETNWNALVCQNHDKACDCLSVGGQLNVVQLTTFRYSEIV